MENVVITVILIMSSYIMISNFNSMRYRSLAWDYAQEAVYWKLELIRAEKELNFAYYDICSNKVEFYSDLSLDYADRSQKPIWKLYA